MFATCLAEICEILHCYDPLKGSVKIQQLLADISNLYTIGDLTLMERDALRMTAGVVFAKFGELEFDGSELFYRHHRAEVSWSDEENCYTGKVMDITNASIEFEALTLEEAERSFHSLIDDYISMRMEAEKNPMRKEFGKWQQSVSRES